MARIFHLSHLLDKEGYKRINLISFYELSKLDKYIEKFANNKEIRKKYEMEISEFCLDNMKLIQDENKRNKRNWTGSIAIICEERNKEDKIEKMFKIPIIYKNDRKLLPKKECLIKIKEKLKEPNVVIEIFNRKKELLSQNEIDLIFRYQKTREIHYLKSAADFFKNRLNNIDDDELLYFYCRDLMDICKLNELSIQTRFGNINNINDDIPKETVLEKVNSYSNDIYFNKLINEEDYDELFKNYDLDEINRNTDMFEKGRKK